MNTNEIVVPPFCESVRYHVAVNFTGQKDSKLSWDEDGVSYIYIKERERKGEKRLCAISFYANLQCVPFWSIPLICVGNLYLTWSINAKGK